MGKSNTGMHNARNNKKDEFYTRIEDIEEELKYYKDQLANKTIICNCDDPIESNFVKYLLLNFKQLDLKRVIATCYDGSPVANTEFSPSANLFGEEFYVGPKSIQTLSSTAYKIDISEVVDFNGDGVVDEEDINTLLKQPGVITLLEGNGDFRSEECLRLLDEADICITNPPFSLFREFVTTMVAHNKKFLILGNMNAITYKEIFPLIKDNKLWVGYHFNTSIIFKTPYENTEAANRKYVISKGCNPDDGYTKVKEIAWFTNLDVTKRHENLIMVEEYSKDNYYTYHNYPAINVDDIKNIPLDYFGYMGVPITYLNKYNPDQFEIINLSRYITESIGLDEEFVTNYNNYQKSIGKKNIIPVGYRDLGYYDKDGIATIPYMRIIIKRKYKDDGSLNND